MSRFLFIAALGLVFIGCDAVGPTEPAPGSVAQPEFADTDPDDDCYTTGFECPGSGGGSGSGGSADPFGPYPRLTSDQAGTAASCPSNGISSASVIGFTSGDKRRFFDMGTILVNGNSYSARLGLMHDAYGSFGSYHAKAVTQVQIYCSGAWRVPKYTATFTYNYFNLRSNVTYIKASTNAQTIKFGNPTDADGQDDLSGDVVADGRKSSTAVVSSDHFLTDANNNTYSMTM